ncbi:IS110 family transposase [Svornostia abyssi]|uniref:IS110 family transposase n=1 Tax=Svornostia abyssi TaxID=2898438 RepID=A0ABY5PJV4_9ACTN|nr:IS110 family transposase [Parviterribacteraceae bacterium J379]UUY02998.1 IS110 family transposase [Parviterribacteraceae bacterium J379]UUY04317.1 IS110 family transposase [Parviterribacteraceae bacterium J379]UUY04941.1 IS110 family transposase [Parviterribacteraceae bacterium J379]
MRFIGMDIHRDFCEIAISEDGSVRSAGRIETSVETLAVFAQSLVADDVVVVEATSGAVRIVDELQRGPARVMVANTRRLPAPGRAKTDKIDARMLARLAASGLLEVVWTPDEQTRALRRICARRDSLVKARTRAKNETQAVLARNLSGRPPVTDLFGKGGRQWLAARVLPADEQLTVDGCLRQIDFLSGEIAALDRALAGQALQSPDIQRLLTVPGVALNTAACFMAAVGDIDRFPTSRKLVGYLGLDPRVRQSGSADARHGRISKEGSALARAMLGEAAWSVAKTPGPLKAFFERVRARKGPQVAATATARKLACLFWCMLTRGEDYAYARPSMTRHKIRQLELLCGATPRKGQKGVAGNRSPGLRDAEREIARQGEAAYRRTVADWTASGPAKVGAGATPGRASNRPSKGKAARQTP